MTDTQFIGWVAFLGSPLALAPAGEPLLRDFVLQSLAEMQLEVTRLKGVAAASKPIATCSVACSLIATCSVACSKLDATVLWVTKRWSMLSLFILPKSKPGHSNIWCDIECVCTLGDPTISDRATFAFVFTGEMRLGFGR
jgi:hypothetical protein